MAVGGGVAGNSSTFRQPGGHSTTLSICLHARTRDACGFCSIGREITTSRWFEYPEPAPHYAHPRHGRWSILLERAAKELIDTKLGHTARRLGGIPEIPDIRDLLTTELAARIRALVAPTFVVLARCPDSTTTVASDDRVMTTS